jgi:hypothetical protein
LLKKLAIEETLLPIPLKLNPVAPPKVLPTPLFEEDLPAPAIDPKGLLVPVLFAFPKLPLPRLGIVKPGIIQTLL